MVNKKYEFTGETKKFSGRTLKRIKRISDGVIGGWIESEENLSHEGWCFIYDEAIVYGEAEVYGEARVCGEAEVYDEARVYGEAIVCGKAIVYGEARVYGEAEVYGEARVCGKAEVCGKARVCGKAKVGSFKILGYVASTFTHIFQLQCQHRLLTAILKEDGQILYSIGCQTEITKEHFIERIYDHNRGLKWNPHRQEYLVAIELAESYFESMKKSR
ncbi:polymer-forming cytoskeletal protein [Phocaeicola vulgatus]|nr:polymer-forming cytoskeletal protein [Phocaeicola vulgatus]